MSRLSSASKAGHRWPLHLEKPAKAREPVKSEAVRVVIAVRAAVGRAHQVEDILPVKLPVHVLETVVFHVRVVEDDG